MRSFARTSLAGLALVALCAGVAPAPSPAPSAAPRPVASGAPAHAAGGASTPAASAAPSNAPGAKRGPAASAVPTAASSLETPYYKVESDEITYKGNGDFTMPHKVTFSRPGSDGTADRAEGNDKRGTVSLFGNVVVHDNGNAPEADTDDEYAKGGPSTLTCDQLDVDSKAKVYTAIGHVHFEQGGRKADAERGVLNRTTGMLHLEGNVKTADGESTLTAQNLDYNVITKHVEANGKPILIKQPVPTPEPGTVGPSPKPKKRRLPFPI
jgi:lipopolysaccharide export system protein LptA